MRNSITENVKQSLKALTKKDIAIMALIALAVGTLCLFSLKHSSTTQANQGSTPATSQIQGFSELELRLASILSKIQGAGSVSVMINQDENGNIIGALILSEGAYQPHTRVQLQLAAKAVLGTSAEQIKIFQIEDQ